MNAKRELIVICNNCYPVPSATGLLALNCINYLHEEFNVRVIAVQDRNHCYYKNNMGTYELYTVKNHRLGIYYTTNSLLKTSTGIRRIFLKFVNFFVRMSGKIDRSVFHIDSYKWFEKKSYKILQKLNSEKKVDVVISVSEPIRAHLSAMKFKNSHPDVRWVCYWGDLYSTSYFKSNIFFSLEKMKKLERKIVSNADYVFTNDEIYEYYRSICPSRNITSIPYTLKSNILNLDFPRIDDETKTFIYYGSLSPTMRNPEYMLNLFLNSTYHLELYTSGCESLIEEYTRLSNGRIRSFGLVESNVLLDKVSKASVLINLGNNNANFIPSKTLELLSYRKPVLDIYYEDNSDTPISKYPSLLRIKNNTDISIAKQFIDEFLQKAENVSRFDVCNIFCMHTEEMARNKVKEAILCNEFNY